MLYSDTEGSALCLAPEKGEESFCGEYTCDIPVSETVDEVWELFEDPVVIHDKECREGAIQHYGFEDEDELDDFLRKKRTRAILAERRGGD